MEGQVIEIFGKRVKVVKNNDISDCSDCAFSDNNGWCIGSADAPLLCEDANGEMAHKFIEV